MKDWVLSLSAHPKSTRETDLLKTASAPKLISRKRRVPNSVKQMKQEKTSSANVRTMLIEIEVTEKLTNEIFFFTLFLMLQIA